MKKPSTNSASKTTNPIEQQPDSINEPKMGYSESDLQPTLLQTNSDPVQNIQNFSYINQIIQGDCQEILKSLPDNCIDLIVTSPPYADQRSTTYGGIPPDMYVDWFIPKADQFLRVLKPTGSFILNIKERVVNGERHTYVMELVIKLRQHGWFWTEEYMWHRKTAIRVNGLIVFETIGNICITSQSKNIFRCIRIQ